MAKRMVTVYVTLPTSYAGPIPDSKVCEDIKRAFAASPLLNGAAVSVETAPENSSTYPCKDMLEAARSLQEAQRSLETIRAKLGIIFGEGGTVSIPKDIRLFPAT